MSPLKMKVRDADLRALVHSRGAHPGTDLYSALVELQRRRDSDREAARLRRARGNGRDRRSSARDRA